MPELLLKYKDDSGDEKSVAVERERFKVGRHSECDLTISDGRLSREHLRIERVGDAFEATDLGSSNGTKLNGEELSGSTVLKNGDALSLGGLEMAVEINAEDQNTETAASAPDVDQGQAEFGPEMGAAASMPQAASPHPAPQASSDSDGLPWLLIVPLFGLIILVFIGGLIYLLIGTGESDIADNTEDDEFVYSTDKNKDEDNGPSGKNENNSSPGGKNSTPIPVNAPGSNGTSSIPIGPGSQPTPQNLSDTGKVEQNGAAFLRRIAQNDPKAFLTSDQAQKVNSKVKQFGKSAALADNINSARKNASQLRSIASSKNLKPQFLAVAAIAKLGNGRGDVVQTAQGIADVLDKLGTQIGNELADDALLMIAAYNQGASGEDKKMRDMLQKLVNNSPDSARTIRTIWFLEKNGKITPGEFENALNFLAIGTITQNPKDFGVNAEPLQL